MNLRELADLNRMSEKEIDILLEGGNNLNINVGILKFTKRGIVVKVSFDNKTKKEFLEYGENLGRIINELIKEYIEEKRDALIKQEEIKYYENELEKLKEEK